MEMKITCAYVKWKLFKKMVDPNNPNGESGGDVYRKHKERLFRQILKL